MAALAANSLPAASPVPQIRSQIAKQFGFLVTFFGLGIRFLCIHAAIAISFASARSWDPKAHGLQRAGHRSLVAIFPAIEFTDRPIRCLLNSTSTAISRRWFSATLALSSN